MKVLVDIVVMMGKREKEKAPLLIRGEKRRGKELKSREGGGSIRELPKAYLPIFTLDPGTGGKATHALHHIRKRYAHRLRMASLNDVPWKVWIWMAGRISVGFRLHVLDRRPL